MWDTLTRKIRKYSRNIFDWPGIFDPSKGVISDHRLVMLYALCFGTGELADISKKDGEAIEGDTQSRLRIIRDREHQKYGPVHAVSYGEQL